MIILMCLKHSGSNMYPILLIVTRQKHLEKARRFSFIVYDYANCDVGNFYWLLSRCYVHQPIKEKTTF